MNDTRDGARAGSSAEAWTLFDINALKTSPSEVTREAASDFARTIGRFAMHAVWAEAAKGDAEDGPAFGEQFHVCLAGLQLGLLASAYRHRFCWDPPIFAL